MNKNEFKAFKDYLKDQLDEGKDTVKNMDEIFEEWGQLPKAVQMRYLEKYKDDEEQNDENEDQTDMARNKQKNANKQGGRGRQSQKQKNDKKEMQKGTTRDRTRSQQYDIADDQLEDELDFKKLKISNRDSVSRYDSKQNSRISQFSSGTLHIKKAYRLETYIKFYREKIEDKKNSD
ncbi:hypothetical protein pb186bvf_005261 [Paramecium bursaria]